MRSMKAKPMEEFMPNTKLGKMQFQFAELVWHYAPLPSGELARICQQELLCRGWFLQPNTYDCGSFVVNGTAVVGKEQNNPYNC